MFEGQSHLYLIKGAASHPLHHHGDEKCPGAQLQLTNCTHKPHVINFGRIYPSLCELHDELFFTCFCSVGMGAQPTPDSKLGYDNKGHQMLMKMGKFTNKNKTKNKNAFKYKLHILNINLS